MMIRLLNVSAGLEKFILVLSIILFVTDVMIGESSAPHSDDALVPRTTSGRSLSLYLCNEPRLDFESYITIDHSVVCSALPSSDIALLENGIMTTYNDLVRPQYCDPFARLISNVTYVSEKSYIDGSQMQVTFLVKGTCQGCDSMPHDHFFRTTYSDTVSNSYNTSDGCTCPVDVAANRTVRQEEFLTFYESTVLKDSPDLVCVTTISGGVVPTRLPSQSPTVLGVDCPVNLSTRLISQVLVTVNENATQLTLEELGQDLMDTYNALMNETYSTCHTNKYRQISNLAVNPISSASAVRTRGRGRIRGRQLQGLALSNETIIFDVEGGCGDGCDPNELFFDPEILSQAAFVEYYSSVMGESGLEFLSEIEILDCPSNSSRFENVVIVEYVPQDSGIVDSTDLSSNPILMQHLEDLFVTTYNDLSRDYCDPYSRQLVSAKLSLVGAINSFGNVPVEMELVGTCSNCDGIDLSIYDLPTAVLELPNATGNDTGLIFFEDLLAGRRLLEWTSSSGRVLQGSDSATDSSCYCPAHPVGSRGVYETEFLDAYRKVINETSPRTAGDSGRKLQTDVLTGTPGLGVAVAECQFGKEFRTSFPFDAEVPGNLATLTEDEKQQILESLRLAIAERFPVSDETCNPEFRVVEIAEIGPTRSTNRRRAQQVTPSPTVGVPDTPAPTVVPVTLAPTVAPIPAPVTLAPTFPLATSSPQPSFALAGTFAPTPALGLLPTLSPTTIPVYVYVTGVCNGCENQITLDDQTIDRRQLEGQENKRTVNDWFRELQSDQSEPTSNCFCPIGSEIVANPTVQELLDLFVANLRSAGIQYPISNFREVPVVDCTVPVTQFSSQFQYTIALESDATVDQVQAVGDIVRSTYNDLSQDYCDPFDQNIDSIELVQFSLSSGLISGNQCQEYDITFQLTGHCRGCSGADTLFSSPPASTARRRSLYQEDLFPYPLQSFSDETASFAQSGKHKSTATRSSSNTLSRRRRLQSSLGDDCFCDGTVVDTRAPSLDEYNLALVAALNDFQVTNVCGIPNFIPTSQPSSTPSAQPTLFPTLAPSPAPSPSPTDSPFIPPFSPVVLPTTPAPTLPPTPPPTLPPTPAPTPPPTLPPTPLPTPPTCGCALTATPLIATASLPPNSSATLPPNSSATLPPNSTATPSPTN